MSTMTTCVKDLVVPRNLNFKTIELLNIKKIDSDLR